MQGLLKFSTFSRGHILKFIWFFDGWQNYFSVAFKDVEGGFERFLASIWVGDDMSGQKRPGFDYVGRRLLLKIIYQKAFPELTMELLVVVI